MANKGIQLRRNEKRMLNDINADKNGRLRFHILGDKGKKKKRIQTREEKIFILASDCLTGDPLIHDLSLTQDMNSICLNGCRIARCMKEYFIFKKNYKGTLNSIILAKSLHHKLWDGSPFLLKQLPGIGMVTAKALHSMGITTFEKLADADPRRIEIVAGRKFPFGDHIKESLLSLPPKVELTLETSDTQRQGKPKLSVTLTRLTQAQSSKRHYADLVVGLEEENAITYHEKIRVDDFLSPYKTTVLLSNHQPGKLIVKADLIFEEFIGVDLHQKIELIDENKSTVTARLGSQKISSSVEPVETRPGKKNTASMASFKKQPIQSSATEELDGMLVTFFIPSPSENRHLDSRIANLPSFKLLDDDLEGIQPSQDDDDECQIISPNKIFDHIRKKAKDFPVITTSGPIQFPVLKPPKPSRAQISADHMTKHSNSEREYRGHGDDHDTIEHEIASTSQPTSNVVNNDPLRSTVGMQQVRDMEKRKESHMIEQHFDHVRKRSKNSPVIVKADQFGRGSLTHSPDHFSFKEPQLSQMVGPPLLSNPGSSKIEQNGSSFIETMTDKRRLPSNRTLNLPFEVLHNDQYKACHKPTSHNSSLLTKDIQFEPPGNPLQPQSSDPPNRLMEVIRGSCSLETETGKKHIDSFLGYKSVFSFL